MRSVFGHGLCVALSKRRSVGSFLCSLILLHFRLMLLELVHFGFLFCCSLLDLSLELNGVQRLWNSIGLNCLATILLLSHSTRWSHWLLMDLLQPIQPILDAHLAIRCSTNVHATGFPLFFELSPLICGQLLSAIIGHRC